MTEAKHPLSGKIDSRKALLDALRALNKDTSIHRWKYKEMRRKIGVISDENFSLWRNEVRFHTTHWNKDIYLPTDFVHNDLHVSKHDGAAFVAFAESEEKSRRDVFTRMKFGKYLTKFHTELDNEQVKKIVADFEYKHGAPPVVKFGETAEDFVHAIKDGPGDSCQADKFYSEKKFEFRGHAHPAVCYATGDIQVAWLENAAGDVTARALINKAKKRHSRPYGDTERLDKQLADLGYEKRVGALIGCRLRKISNDNGCGWLMPYVDAGTGSGGGSLRAYDDGGGYWVLSEDGGVDTYCGYDKGGVTESDEEEDADEDPEHGFCERCGDPLHDGDSYSYSEHEGSQYCDSCVSRFWTYAIVSVGRNRNNFNFDYVSNNNVTYIDCLGESAWDDIIDELDVVKDENRGEYVHLEDAARSVWGDNWYHRDDCVEVGEKDGETLWIHNDDLKDRNLAEKIYYDADNKPFWYESDEIQEWIDSGEDLDKYALRAVKDSGQMGLKIEDVKIVVEAVKGTIHVDQREAPQEADYKDLIERVRIIDPAAAEYLEGDARRLDAFKPHRDLVCVLAWGLTPQGHQYWSDINDKLLASWTWQMTYRWMQSRGVAFDCGDGTGRADRWTQMTCYFDTGAIPSHYRIRPEQPEPPNWRETFLEAQRRGVKFEIAGIRSGNLGFRPYPMGAYSIMLEEVQELTQERMAA